jgi:hypothetical protein
MAGEVATVTRFWASLAFIDDDDGETGDVSCCVMMKLFMGVKLIDGQRPSEGVAEQWGQ